MSKMPAKIWARKDAVLCEPIWAPFKYDQDDTAFIRADIVAQMVDALEKIVADRDETEMQFLGQPTQIRNSSIENARASLSTYRKEISHAE